LWNYRSTGEAIWSALKKASKKIFEGGKFFILFYFMLDGAPSGEGIGRRGDGGGLAIRSEMFFIGMLCWVYAGSTGEGIGCSGDGGGRVPGIRS
jgi:hypothetical protein